ncbi:hypothetical protein [Jannaschia sp. CCS1]|uniref:hypothetical protein n=1 Tax=Jannaschia sp. (strain CCS1) TaxID=290400 RepID=UPI000053A9BF|nr:hypothetical protein [Jannaschia sp. CCS1]ABD56261.1 hypothetical protein Jann_3344 [Jannaschia sp. CCS1]
MRRILPFVLALVWPAMAAAQEAERYVTFVFGTAHFGADLNDFNPGLMVGRRWHGARDGLEFHLEGGVVYNSYDEVSPIVMGGISQRLTTIGPVEVRGGLSFGTAYYGELAPRLERDYNIPNIDGFIPLLLPSLSLRHEGDDRFDYRLTVLPGDEGIGGLNLSLAVRF